MKKFLKWIFLAIIALVFIWTFVFLYNKSRPQHTEYDIVQPEKAELMKTTIVTGKIQPRDEVFVKPQINGIIAELYKKAGDKVKKDEIIAKVKVIPDMGTLNSAESAVRLASISLKQAETDFQRMKTLFDQKLISSEEYEKSLVVLNQSREEMRNREDALNIIKEGISKSNTSFSTTLVRSTIDGLILDIPVQVGNSVIMSNTMNDGTTIASVANMSDLIFKGKIDETEVGRIRMGMPVKITVGALQNQTFEAVLEYIAPKAVEENGANLFEIEAALKGDNSGYIRSGYSSNAEIVLEKASQVLAIPEGCLEFNLDSVFVYVMKTQSPQTFERRQIKTGISDGLRVEVKQGITAKEKLRGAKKENDK